VRTIAGAGIAFWSSISALTSWFFLELIGKMGYVGYFYVESKSFEIRVGDGSQNIKLTEWGRMNLSTVYLGETKLIWLVKMMTELVSETTGIGACRDHRLGGSVMFLQKRMNKYGRFMEITEYGRGGRRSFVVIPEGREGQGWRNCILQMGRLVKYLEQVRDMTKKSLPVQPRAVVPGRTFADVVEGKKPETGTEKREEGSMGISAAEINVETVENFEKGKEKILKPVNQAALKWEDLVVTLNEGVFNMRIMRDMLEDIKGKMEILGSRYEPGCVEKKKENMDTQHGPCGPKVQLGQDDGVKEIGPRLNKPNLCCSKTYYRRRYRAVAKRRATRMLRREQKGTEMSPEESTEMSPEGSPEVRCTVAIDRREQKGPEMSPELSKEVGRHIATDRCEQKGTEMSPELSKEVGRHIATDRCEQKGPEMTRRGQKETKMSPEVSQEARCTVVTVRCEQKGPEMPPELSPEVICAGATDCREQKGPEMSPELIPEIRRSVETDYLIHGVSNYGLESSGVKAPAREEVSVRENVPVSGGGRSKKEENAVGRPNKADQTMGQSKSPRGSSRGSWKGHRSCSPELRLKFPGSPTVSKEDSDDYLIGQQSKEIMVMEGSTENELLGVGQGVDAGLEDIASGSVPNSWVVDSCMEFYPKVGVTCEGGENNMKSLITIIEEARQQPVVEGEGVPNNARVSRQMRELKNFDNYVNYDRGMSDVQLGKGRGRGKKGVL
jgi:hypothetical protein